MAPQKWSGVLDKSGLFIVLVVLCSIARNKGEKIMNTEKKIIGSHVADLFKAFV